MMDLRKSGGTALDRAHRNERTRKKRRARAEKEIGVVQVEIQQSSRTREFGRHGEERRKQRDQSQD